jgi:hypothetical protein
MIQTRLSKRNEEAIQESCMSGCAVLLLLEYIMLLLPHGAATNLRSGQPRPFLMPKMAPLFAYGHVAAVDPSCASGGGREASLVVG